MLVTIGVLLCYPYDKNDPYLLTITGDEEHTDDPELGVDEASSLIKSKSSPSATSSRKSIHLESETDSKGQAHYGNVHVTNNQVLDLNPKNLMFEPMCYLFEMCMVFTNVGGESLSSDKCLIILTIKFPFDQECT